MTVELLNPHNTQNIAAWLASIYEEMLASNRLVIVCLKETGDDAASGVQGMVHNILYFKMNEVWLTWAAAKLADCAQTARGPMLQDD